MRSDYVFTCDKENEFYTRTLEKFDLLIGLIVGRIKEEWNKRYKK